MESGVFLLNELSKKIQKSIDKSEKIKYVYFRPVKTDR